MARAPIDSNHHKGLIVRDGLLGSEIELTGESLANSNALHVAIVDGSGDQITSFGGGTQYTEGNTDASITGTALMFEGAADTLVAAPGTAANGLDVDVTRVSGTVTVDGSGVTQPVSHAALTELAAAIDTEVQVDVVGALPAGTNALGKLLPPDVDVTTHTNYAKKYYTNAGAVTDGIVWSPAAGKRWHVVSMFINVSAAATVTFEDDKAGGDEAVMKMELAANSGMTINFGEKYPLASGEDAADLLVTTSAGNVYITVTGYEI